MHDTGASWRQRPPHTTVGEKAATNIPMNISVESIGSNQALTEIMGLTELGASSQEPAMGKKGREAINIQTTNI